MEDVGLCRPVPASRVLGARRDDHPQPTLGRLSYEAVHRIEALGAEEARGRVLCAALHAVALLDRVVPEQRNKAHQVGAASLRIEAWFVEQHLDDLAVAARRRIEERVAAGIRVDEVDVGLAVEQQPHHACVAFLRRNCERRAVLLRLLIQAARVTIQKRAHQFQRLRALARRVAAHDHQRGHARLLAPPRPFRPFDEERGELGGLVVVPLVARKLAPKVATKLSRLLD